MLTAAVCSYILQLKWYVSRCFGTCITSTLPCLHAPYLDLCASLVVPTFLPSWTADLIKERSYLVGGGYPSELLSSLTPLGSNRLLLPERLFLVKHCEVSPSGANMWHSDT